MSPGLVGHKSRTLSPKPLRSRRVGFSPQWFFFSKDDLGGWGEVVVKLFWFYNDPKILHKPKHGTPSFAVPGRFLYEINHVETSKSVNMHVHWGGLPENSHFL